jgi:hypothetical protein
MKVTVSVGPVFTFPREVWVYDTVRRQSQTFVSRGSRYLVWTTFALAKLENNI